MKSFIRCTALCLCAAMLTGCSSLVGTWKTVKVTPAGFDEAIGFQRVTFHDDGTYTATLSYNGQQMAASGEYEWDGSTLEVETGPDEEREYTGEMKDRETLVLSCEENGQKLTGTLKRVQEQD